MDPKERPQTACGSIVINSQKSPDQQLLEEKGGILSCGGVYLPSAATPSPFKKEDTYQFLFLPNYRQGVIMYKNLEAQHGSDPEITFQDPSLREAGTSHEALRRFFKEGLN